MDSKDLEAISSYLEEEAKMREQIREATSELEKKVRTMTGILNKVHGTPTAQFPELVASIQPYLGSVHENLETLTELVKPEEFWRVKDMWAKHLQSAVYVICMCEWLKTGKLATIDQVSKELGVKPEWQDRFVLASEDYLHGVISVTNELARLAVNAVIMKDFELPGKIYTFVKEIHSGFCLLNLKNDPLRRRFDSIKYDVKRIEEGKRMFPLPLFYIESSIFSDVEHPFWAGGALPLTVVYDISLRKLGEPDSTPGVPAAEDQATLTSASSS